MSYLKSRYPIVWDEVYHGTIADCKEAIPGPTERMSKIIERIAHKAAAFAVCAHHKQWCVSALNYPKQLKSYKPALRKSK
jgi:hypothetical protein